MDSIRVRPGASRMLERDCAGNAERAEMRQAIRQIAETLAEEYAGFYRALRVKASSAGARQPPTEAGGNQGFMRIVAVQRRLQAKSRRVKAGTIGAAASPVDDGLLGLERNVGREQTGEAEIERALCHGL